MRSMVGWLAAVMTLLIGCQSQYEACQPISEEEFSFDRFESAVYTSDTFGSMRIIAVYQHEEIPSLPMIDLFVMIEEAMLLVQDQVGPFDTSRTMTWTIYVVGSDSAVWVSPEAYADTLGCTIPQREMFPALVAGESQMVISDFGWESDDALTTVEHEAVHSLLFYATGDSDADHITDGVWDILN